MDTRLVQKSTGLYGLPPVIVIFMFGLTSIVTVDCAVDVSSFTSSSAPTPGTTALNASHASLAMY